jgi:RNA polymerase sigma factor (sigma-70 family)
MHPVERCARTCAEPAWRVAHALLRDAHEAFDAVQQAFLVAARKPEAVPAGDPWPWFCVVVAREAQNLRRKRRPATNRLDSGEGGGMEAPDLRAPEPARAASASDEARRLLQEVEALPAPEREAVLLTHLGGLTHAAAAEALGLPRQTLTERARRGVETVAARMRRSATAAAGALAAFPLPPPPRGFEAARAAWLEGARHAAPAVGGLAVKGGSLVAASKTGWVAGVALGAGIGFLGGAATDGFGLLDPSRPPAETSAPAPATARAADGRDAAVPFEGATLSAADASERERRLRAENDRLAARVSDLERSLAREAAPSPPARRGPLFTFGEMGSLAAVREADWAALGAAAKAVNGAIVEIHRKNAAGLPVPKELHLLLQENVERVRTYEYRTIDRMPTAAKHNGELTHPISVTNLLASILEQEGVPLSPGQVAEFERLGVAFDEEFARVRAGWTSDVPRARRLVQEVRAKGTFAEALWGVLAPEQRPHWVDPAFRGVASLDLFDPTLMVVHTSPVLTGTQVSEIRPKLLFALRPKVGLAPDAPSARLEAAADAFLSRTARGLEAVARAKVKHYTFAESLAAGEATADLVDALLRDMDLSPEARRALLDDPTWYVPRLVKG